MHRYVICCILFYPVLLTGQNLIPNPGFEQGKNGRPIHWFQPDGLNFHWSKAGQYGYPRTGKWFNGICISNVEYSEALTVQLHDTLTGGQPYHISGWLRKFPGTQGTYNPEVSREWQVLLTWGPPNPLPKHPYKVPERQLTRIPLPPDTILISDSSYQYFEATFIPSGGERYISFGFFQRKDPSRPLISRYMLAKQKRVDPSQSDDPINAAMLANGDLVFRVRYYADDFCLAPIQPDGSYSCIEYTAYKALKDSDTLPVTGIREKPRPPAPITLKNVLFKFDTTILLPGSYPTLDSLVTLLKAHPTWVIQINAHTDERGSADYNLQLSIDRAKAVVAYLVARGIPRTQLRYKGYGETQPIVDAQHADEHQRNRRVAFEILQR